MLSVRFLSLELWKHLFDSITSYVNHAWQDNLARQLPSLCMLERRLLRGQNTIYRKQKKKNAERGGSRNLMVLVVRLTLPLVRLPICL